MTVCGRLTFESLQGKIIAPHLFSAVDNLLLRDSLRSLCSLSRRLAVCVPLARILSLWFESLQCKIIAPHLFTAVDNLLLRDSLRSLRSLSRRLACLFPPLAAACSRSNPSSAKQEHPQRGALVLVYLEGFEPPSFRFVAERYIQLSYRYMSF